MERGQQGQKGQTGSRSDDGIPPWLNPFSSQPGSSPGRGNGVSVRGVGSRAWELRSANDCSGDVCSPQDRPPFLVHQDYQYQPWGPHAVRNLTLWHTESQRPSFLVTERRHWRPLTRAFGDGHPAPCSAFEGESRRERKGPPGDLNPRPSGTGRPSGGPRQCWTRPLHAASTAWKGASRCW